MIDEPLRILAIDDNADSLITIRALIREAFPASIFISTQTATQGIELAISEDPDVILLDVVMDGMDGISACRHLKADEHSRHIPVIMVTALKSDRQTRIDALEAGAEGFLAKPIDPVELVALVNTMAKIKKASVAQRIQNEELASLVMARTHTLEHELHDRIAAEQELQMANLKLKQTQVATLNLLEDLSHEMMVRRQFETELVIAKERAEESDRLKSAFLANMSHEIRTPMNGIIGFSGLLSEPDVTDKERDRFVKIINDNCQQLLHIVTDIIDISKIEAGMTELENIDFCLNELMDSLLENYLPKARSKGLSMMLTKELECSDCSIAGDPSKIRQVLDNLLTNALKFTPHGEVNFGYKLVYGKLEFFVYDTGIGIEPEHQEAVFNRFWQVETGLARKYGGTGLGLSISRAFIRKMGGDIRFDSAPGKGSKFIFDIPYHHSGQKQSVTPVSHQPHEDLTQRTILVVEDEEFNFEFLEIVLMKHNLNILFHG